MLSPLIHEHGLSLPAIAFEENLNVLPSFFTQAKNQHFKIRMHNYYVMPSECCLMSLAAALMDEIVR